MLPPPLLPHPCGVPYTPAMDGPKVLRWIALVSALYDLLLALPLLLFPRLTASLFGLPAPQPLVNAQLNGVFALALAAGYLWASRDPTSRRGYFWAAGVLAKGLGAFLFLFDHVVRSSPPAFLLFTVTDGGLAMATAAALLATGDAPAPRSEAGARN